jgi:c-di-GMP-binding flagellar brake protein YcgR
LLEKRLGPTPRWEPANRRMRDMSEPRFDVELPTRVFGVDADDHAFSQIAHMLNISNRRARIAGVKARLKTGDVIEVHFGDKKARCRVIWVVEAGTVETIEVGVKVVEGQPCPWQTEMEAQRSTGAVPISRAAPAAKEKRGFSRQRVSLQIEIQVGQASDAPMRTQTADIAGGGCYIETMLPFSVGKRLLITFWLNSERVRTPAIVRTSDRGVGMGIEFVGLDEATQKRLQQHVESIAVESAAVVSGAEITNAWIPQ